MSDKGWIVKATDDEDKRFIRIYLTGKAKKLKPLLLAERKKSNEEILSNLSLKKRPCSSAS